MAGSGKKELTERDLKRLVKLLKMLGSSAVGERAAAALKVVEFVNAYALTWEDLIFPPEPEPVPIRVRVGKGEAEILRLQRALAVAEQARQAAEEGLRQAQNARMELERALRRAEQAKPPAGTQSPGPGTTATSYVRYSTGYVGEAHQASETSQAPPVWPHATRPPFVVPVLTMLTQHRHLLRGDREVGFLTGLIARGKSDLTARQWDWMTDICRRAGLVIMLPGSTSG